MAAWPIYGYLYIPFTSMQAYRGIDTILDSREFSTLQLRVTWGDVNDLWSTNPTAAAWDTEPAIDVMVDECFGEDLTPVHLFTQYEYEYVVDATNPARRLEMPVGNVIRHLNLIEHRDGDPVANILGKVTLQHGTEVIYEAEDLLHMLANCYKSELAALVNGLHVIDPTAMGMPASGDRLTEMIDARLMGRLDLISDLTSAGATDRLTVLVDEVVMR